MKTLELQEMENLQGGDGLWTGFACGMTLLAGAGVITATGGAAALPVAYVAGAACGSLLGYGGASGDWF